jgi:hypothetical protein
MSRSSKILLLLVVLVFSLACALVTNPINDVKNTAGTAQAFATDINALTTQAAPLGTLIANPSLIPNVGDYFNPQGTPVAEWNGIPIMPQATAGQEHDQANYSFKFTGTVQEAQDFYNSSLETLGWSNMLSMPGDEQGALLVFQKESGILTITITAVEGSTVVLLTLA